MECDSWSQDTVPARGVRVEVKTLEDQTRIVMMAPTIMAMCDSGRWTLWGPGRSSNHHGDVDSGPGEVLIGNVNVVALKARGRTSLLGVHRGGRRGRRRRRRRINRGRSEAVKEVFLNKS